MGSGEEQMVHKRAQNRRNVAFWGVLLLLTTGTFVWHPSTASTANATTSNLITGLGRAGVAETVSSSRFPSGSSTVVVAQDESNALHLAANFATWSDLPVVVSASGTTAANVISEIGSYSPSNVVLVSSTSGWFTTSFTADLTAASISVSALHDSSDLFTRWSAAAGTGHDEYVFARSDNSEAVLMATAYAASRGAPLVVWQSTTAGSLLADFFGDITASRLTFFDQNVVPVEHLDAADLNALVLVPMDDLRRASTWIATQAQLAGRDVSRVVVAARDRIDEVSLAGVYARAGQQLVLPGGTTGALGTGSRAGEYLTLWRSGAKTVALVGSGFGSSELTAVLSPTTSSHAAAPTFRTTSFTRTSTSFTIGFTAVSGATSYKFYDPMGTLVATSPTPSVAFTSPTGGVLAVAQGSTGELARLDVHLNSYGLDDEIETIIMVGAEGGTNRVQILSDIATPRLITRSVTDHFSEFPSLGEHEPIAITCATEFTDVTGDATKEYEYTAIDLTNVNVGTCSSSHPLSEASDDPTIVSTVKAPPTDFPWLRAAQRPLTSGTTFAQAYIDSSVTGAESSAALGPGDDWPPLTTRWVAYIPEARIVGPGFSGDVSRPVIMFGGDNHGTNQPNESVRFRQDVTFNFGAGNSRVYAEHMGATQRYHCLAPYVSCVLNSTATASTSGLNLLLQGGGATWGRAILRAEATNPLLSYAPPIDTQVRIELAQGRSYVAGYHDNMPKHEFYTGEPFSFFYKAYESSYVSYVVQVGCLLSAPTLPIPGCGVLFNALI